jgi:hypothetical protein
MWNSAKTFDDIIDLNIGAILRKNHSPFMIINLNEEALYPDVKPYLDVILQINKLGFMTIDSQLSSKYDLEYEKITDEDCGFYIETENKECCGYQRAYCGGFLKKSLYEKIIRIKENGYTVLNYDYKEGDKKTDMINLTLHKYTDCDHYPTNYHSIDEMAKSDLEILQDEIQCEIDDVYYVIIFDHDYNTGKNIYHDILNAISEVKL